MTITILTIFPEILGDATKPPVIRRAIQNEQLKVRVLDIRDYAPGSFRRIDDSPYGGGRGMILRCQPVVDAIEDAEKTGLEESPVQESKHRLTVALTPAGTLYSQKTARRYAALDHLILVCGHYEGMDERIYRYCDEKLSIGDYILTGGELAAQVVLDSVARLLPGSLRDGSSEEESFEDGLLEYPQYTRPKDFRGDKVPEVLLSGNHEAIRLWRKEAAYEKTLRERPDLIVE